MILASRDAPKGWRSIVTARYSPTAVAMAQITPTVMSARLFRLFRAPPPIGALPLTPSKRT
jgi:hypothetical protein